MGDAQVFAPTAARNADVAAFFTKWMIDVNDGQLAAGPNAGAYSDVSPRVARPAPAWPVWGDAGVIVPWVMYRAYGDRGFLEANYAAMSAWMDFSVRRSRDLIATGGVGDHLAPPAQAGRGGGSFATVSVVDTAYMAHAAQLLAKTATILEKTQDAAKYNKLYEDVRAAFQKAFVSPQGRIQGDTQTVYLLALQFGLLPDDLRPPAAKFLAENVEKSGHLTTGFVGVGLINPTLTLIGRSDLAYDLLLNDTYPSWLFTVKQGATTIWERWDGWTPEKGFQDSSMNSFNHYSLGSVGEWLYSGAAGIGLDEARPGYKHFFLSPQVTRRLEFVRAAIESPYGTIRSAWRNEGGRLVYEATVPPNTTATVRLPGQPDRPVEAGTHRFVVENAFQGAR
jgi:alpha-L-rhamnosidase